MITSTANEKVKFVKKLHDKKNRDAENLFIAEGVNILSDLKEGFSVKEIFATDKTADIAENLAKKYGACTTLVSESVMKVLADTVSPSGILAVIGIPLSKPEGVNAVVLDGVQDSGNVGTIIRTAVGAGFFDVYLVDSADAFSPKTVRASMGAVLRANVIISPDTIRSRWIWVATTCFRIAQKEKSRLSSETKRTACPISQESFPTLPCRFRCRADRKV